MNRELAQALITLIDASTRLIVVLTHRIARGDLIDEISRSVQSKVTGSRQVVDGETVITRYPIDDGSWLIHRRHGDQESYQLEDHHGARRDIDVETAEYILNG